ncbi:MAG: Crp/Fnr family transcriptional regulator [Lachnospiraceae bacterium]|nr:Crp/Fnr family transcriptional regulator [Lachnospiraceae bacterium]
MDCSEYFPIWDKLTPVQQNKIRGSAIRRSVKKGAVIHSGSTDCTGLLLIRSGHLRAYILSEDGREISIYRLFELDICLLSASCMMQNIQFDITIEAEKDSELWIIPPENYKELMEESAPLANYTNQIMASRFSEVMWLIEQIMWRSFDKRLAAFLLEESMIEETGRLRITHEKIGNHLGSAREVVTRMLHYFQKEGIVKLTRGSIEILDTKRLQELAHT